MNRLAFLLILALVLVAACAQASSSPPQSVTPLVTPPIVTATPTDDPTASLVVAAQAYAGAAGFDVLADVAPQIRRHEAGYEPTVLWEVSFALAGEGGDSMALRIYLDDDGQIRAVDNDLGFPEPSGAGISRAEALQRAALALGLLGLDATQDQLSVATAIPGREWIIMLSRMVDDHPVANHWASTGIAGDRVWVTLRGDGALVELYAIQPPTQPLPEPILASAELDERLASAAGLSATKLATLDPQLTWIRAIDEDGAEAAVLTLAYCATRVEPSGWEAWCVDAATGVRNVHAWAAD